MKLIIGLGNPGKEYDWTRHNIGFSFINYYCEKNNITLNNDKFNGLYTKTRINNEDVIIAKPMTYMNLSGEFIRKIIDFYKISALDILVIYDDLNLEIGVIRFREKGSAGGHNGIKSIISHLGNEYFNRIKIGIGPVKGDTKNFVLSKFSLEDKTKILNRFNDISKLVDYFIDGQINKGLSILNDKKQ